MVHGKNKYYIKNGLNLHIKNSILQPTKKDKLRRKSTMNY